MLRGYGRIRSWGLVLEGMLGIGVADEVVDPGGENATLTADLPDVVVGSKTVHKRLKFLNRVGPKAGDAAVPRHEERHNRDDVGPEKAAPPKRTDEGRRQ